MGGDSVDARDADGVTPLMYAAEAGHAEVVGLLLQQGANPNLGDSQYGMTALMVSAAEGHVDVVRLLLDANAMVDAKDNDLGATALMGAAEHGHAEVIAVLLARGADANAKSKKGFAALAQAATNGHLETVRLLLRAGAHVNAQDDQYGATPLMGAAANGFRDVLELLLSEGADVTLKAKSGLTARGFAETKHEQAIVDILRRRETQVGVGAKPAAASRPRVVVLGVRSHMDYAEQHWGQVLSLALLEDFRAVPEVITVDVGLLGRVAGEFAWKGAQGADPAKAIDRMAFCRADYGVTANMALANGNWTISPTLHISAGRKALSGEFSGTDLLALATEVALWALEEIGVTPPAQEVARMRTEPAGDLAALEEVALAMLELEEARGHSAVGHSKRAIDLDSKCALAHESLGNAYSLLGESELALAAYGNALALDPTRTSRANMAVIYRKKGDVDRAMQEYDKVLKERRDVPYLWVQRAVAYNYMRESDKAMQCFREALRLDPYVPDAHYLLGIMYRERGMMDESKNELRQAIEDYPADVQAHVMLAAVHQLNGDVDEAIRVLEQGIARNPKYGKAHNNLAALYAAKGMYDVAWQHVREAQRLGFEVSPEVLETLRANSKEP